MKINRIIYKYVYNNLSAIIFMDFVINWTFNDLFLLNVLFQVWALHFIRHLHDLHSIKTNPQNTIKYNTKYIYIYTCYRAMSKKNDI